MNPAARNRHAMVSIGSSSLTVLVGGTALTRSAGTPSRQLAPDPTAYVYNPNVSEKWRLTVPIGGFYTTVDATAITIGSSGYIAIVGGSASDEQYGFGDSWYFVAAPPGYKLGADGSIYPVDPDNEYQPALYHFNGLAASFSGSRRAARLNYRRRNPGAVYWGPYHRLAVFGGEIDSSSSLEWTEISNLPPDPLATYIQSYPQNNWLFIKTSGSHISGSGVVYPNSSSILLVGGKTNPVGNLSASVEKVHIGSNANGTVLSSTNLSGTGSLAVMRYAFGSCIAPDGKFWVVGGRASDGDAYLSSTEIFDFTAQSWSAGPALPAAVANGALIAGVGTDEVFLVGGDNGTASLPGYVIRVGSTGSGWTSLSSSVVVARTGHRVTSTNDGKIFVFGGEYYTGSTRFVHPWGREEISYRTGVLAYETAIAGWTFTSGTEFDTIEVRSRPGYRLWPPNALVISKASRSNGQGNPWDIVNDASGVLPSSSAQLHVEAYRRDAVDYVKFYVPRGTVMNRATASFSTIKQAIGSPSQGNIVAVPDWPPSPRAVHNDADWVVLGGPGTSIQWNGNWLDNPREVYFTCPSVYGTNAGVKITGSLSNSGSFLTIFATPSSASFGYDVAGERHWLRQNTAHTATVVYNVNGQLKHVTLPGNIWQSSNVGAANRFIDVGTVNLWRLNTTSSAVVNSGTGPSWDLGSSYTGSEANSRWPGGRARRFSATTSSVATGPLNIADPGSDPLSSIWRVACAPATSIDFWYASTASGTSFVNQLICEYRFSGTHIYPDSPLVLPGTTASVNANISNVRLMSIGFDTSNQLFWDWDCGSYFTRDSYQYEPDILSVTFTTLLPRDGQKHHVAITRERGASEPGNLCKLYIDGVLREQRYPLVEHDVVEGYVVTGNGSGLTRQLPGDSNNFSDLSGSYAPGSSGTFWFGPWDAYVNNFAMSDVLLKPDEVRRAYQQGAGVVY